MVREPVGAFSFAVQSLSFPSRASLPPSLSLPSSTAAPSFTAIAFSSLPLKMLGLGFEIKMGDSSSHLSHCVHGGSLLCYCHFIVTTSKMLGLGYEIETRDSSLSLSLSPIIHGNAPFQILALPPSLAPFVLPSPSPSPSLFLSLLPLFLPLCVFDMSKNGMVWARIVLNQSPTGTSSGTTLVDLDPNHNPRRRTMGEERRRRGESRGRGGRGRRRDGKRERHTGLIARRRMTLALAPLLIEGDGIGIGVD